MKLPLAGLLAPEAAAEMRQWEHAGGFSLDAAVRIEATGPEGAGKPGPRMALLGAPRMQRLLRYCARPIFADLEAEAPRFAHLARVREVIQGLPHASKAV